MKIKKQTYLVKTQYGSFQCVFEPERDMGGYAVEALGIQGAVSWGKSMSEAKKMIKEAIEGSIEAHIISKAVEKGSVRIISRNPFTAAA